MVINLVKFEANFRKWKQLISGIIDFVQWLQQLKMYFTVYKKESKGDFTEKFQNENLSLIQSELEEFIDIVQQWKGKSLDLSLNYRAPILKGLFDIKFECLKEIKVWDNQIESIQRICWIWMPEIQSLDISRNKLGRLKPLRKGDWKQIKVLQFQRNKILDSEVIAELRGEHMKQIVLEQRFMDNHQCSSIKWVAKIEGKEVQKIWINHEKRILDKRIESILNKKYQSLKLIKEK